MSTLYAQIYKIGYLFSECLISMSGSRAEVSKLFLYGARLNVLGSCTKKQNQRQCVGTYMTREYLHFYNYFIDEIENIIKIEYSFV